MDHLELRPGKSKVIVSKDKNEEIEVVDFLLNGRPLVDIVREIEMPSAVKEGARGLAGDYASLTPHLIYLPSRHLLDKPQHPLGSRSENKTVLMVCGSCGEWGCWPLVAKVSLTDEIVRWHAFEQPHRPEWNYNLELNFDRFQYERVLRKG